EHLEADRPVQQHPAAQECLQRAQRQVSAGQLTVSGQLGPERGLDVLIGQDRERTAPVQLAEQVEEQLPELVAAVDIRVVCHLVEDLETWQRAAEDHTELRHVPECPRPERAAAGYQLERQYVTLGTARRRAVGCRVYRGFYVLRQVGEDVTDDVPE